MCERDKAREEKYENDRPCKKQVYPIVEFWEKKKKKSSEVSYFKRYKTVIPIVGNYNYYFY